MRILSRLLAALAALLLVVACGDGGGASADSGKTPDELKAQAKTMEKADLEKIIEEYKGLIADKEKEAGELAQKITESLTDLASGAADDLKKESEDLGKEIGDLKTRLQIYLDELATK